MMNAKIQPVAELSATIIRADGSHRDTLLSRDTLPVKKVARAFAAPLTFWGKLYANLRRSNLIPLGMTLAAFVQYLHSHDTANLALVTTTGVNYLAADFLSSSSNHISAFNFHDSGTGTTAAAIGDSALQTQAGPATRATGTQSTPVAGQYRSVGTISYVSTLAITEWGLFSAATGAVTMWDHRVFTSIGVNSGDSISFQYTLTVPAGGS